MTLKAGDTVTIRKGVTIKSTHPTSPVKEAGRTYKVQIRDAYEATKVAVGHRNYDANGVVDHESFSFYDRRDPDRIKAIYGSDDPEQLREHLTEGKRYDRPDGTSHTSLFLAVDEAKVVWAGAGGYWCYVAQKDLPESQGTA